MRRLLCRCERRIFVRIAADECQNQAYDLALASPSVSETRCAEEAILDGALLKCDQPKKLPELADRTQQRLVALLPKGTKQFLLERKTLALLTLSFFFFYLSLIICTL